MSKVYCGAPIEIIFQENSNEVPTRVQILKVGNFHDPRYGIVKVTEDHLARFVKNFAEKVRRLDIAIDYSHKTEEIAAGWFKELTTDANGTELWANIDWTPAGHKVLSDKEFRYLSADFDFNYQDNETLIRHGAVLKGAGLTNRPVVKGMAATIALQEIDGSTTREELQGLRKKRSAEFGIEETNHSILNFSLGFPNNLNQYGDPVNLNFPFDTVESARNARVRFKQSANEIYKLADSKRIVHERIVREQLKLGVRPGFDSDDELDKLLPSELKNQLQKGESVMDEKELLAEIKTLKGENVLLAEQVKKFSDHDLSPEEMMAKIKELESKLAEAMAENKSFKESTALAEKTAAFDKLLSEKKAVPAQKEAYLADDMTKFIELSEEANIDPQGHGGKPPEKKADGDKSAEDEVIELTEKKLKDNEGMAHDEAMSLVLSENPKLNETYEANMAL